MPLPFLRIPPFPGHRAAPLARPGHDVSADFDVTAVAGALRAARVGGAFWAAQPDLPAGRDVVLAPASAAQLREMLGALTAAERSRAVVLRAGQWPVPADVPAIAAPCDPWWLADHAALCLCDADADLALVAMLAETPLRLFGQGRYCDSAGDPERAVRAALGLLVFADPFTAARWTALQAIAQLGEWRRLIDANRTIFAVFGVAGWKRVTADPMLWDGSGPVRHRRRAPRQAGRSAQLAVWKSRMPGNLLAALTASGARLGEVEDGFIRSVGLGANCVPPLSLIVDFAGVYFDPNGPSDLEGLLENYHIGEDMCRRAAALRQSLVQAAISKYGHGGAAIIRPEGNRRRILVTGQVEDDRSVLSGGAGTSNLELLSRARALEPDAWIIYKPHPDVEAGHRKGHVPEPDALRFADEVQRDAPIIPLIDSVDALHVITSLAGFEALLRGKQVTTHGVPFYAGWGLTHDLAAMPPRRTRRRSLDELVAGALLLYPRYVDPVTRLPCPAEVVVRRMAAGEARVTSPLIHLREWQGRLRLAWRRLAGGA